MWARQYDSKVSSDLFLKMDFLDCVSSTAFLRLLSCGLSVLNELLSEAERAGVLCVCGEARESIQQKYREIKVRNE